MRVLARVYGNAQLFDHAAQHRRTALVQLRAHQRRGELHHMRGQGHVLEGIGGFKAEQSTAHHHADLRLRAGCLDGVEVFDGAVDVAVRQVAAFDGRHEGIGSGGEDERVVANAPPLVSEYALRVAIYLCHPFAHMHRRS